MTTNYLSPKRYSVTYLNTCCASRAVNNSPRHSILHSFQQEKINSEDDYFDFPLTAPFLLCHPPCYHHWFKM